MDRVLVLNQDYYPLTVCGIQRAFLLVYLKKAELVDSVSGLSLRTVTTSFPFPSVIRITNYINVPYKGVILSRHNIFKRDGFTCQYCGTRQSLTLDHLVPRSKGGKSTWTNLVTACKSCNAKKGDSHLEETEMALRTLPIKPSHLFFLKNAASYNENWNKYLNTKSMVS